MGAQDLQGHQTRELPLSIPSTPGRAKKIALQPPVARKHKIDPVTPQGTRASVGSACPRHPPGLYPARSAWSPRIYISPPPRRPPEHRGNQRLSWYQRFPSWYYRTPGHRGSGPSGGTMKIGGRRRVKHAKKFATHSDLEQI
jgi:hypothetical protein